MPTTSTVFSSESGFSTKSNAPSLIARTADSMLPWPEIITTGASTRRSRSRASVTSPSMPGSQMSSTIASYGARDTRSRHASPESDRLDVIALVAQHAAQRAAHAGLVVHDEDVGFHGFGVSFGSASGSRLASWLSTVPAVRKIPPSCEAERSCSTIRPAVDREHRARRHVVGDLDAAAVLGDDAADDGQAEAAAAPLGRIVRHEQLVAVGGRNAGAVVGDENARHAVDRDRAGSRSRWTARRRSGAARVGCRRAPRPRCPPG